MKKIIFFIVVTISAYNTLKAQEKTNKAINQVNWFEIPVTDMNRAKIFYETVFQKTLTIMPFGGGEMAMFPWIPGATNASGALVKNQNYKPSLNGTKIYFQCEDVNKEIELAKSNGGQVIVTKTNIGEFGNIALITDTEGNLIGLHSMK